MQWATLAVSVFFWTGVSACLSALHLREAERYPSDRNLILSFFATHFLIWLLGLSLLGLGIIMNRGRGITRDSDGKPRRFLDTHTDISELKHVAQKLELHSAALAATANAIVITDYNGIIQWVNPSFTRLTGYTAQEAIGQNPRILKSGINSAEFYQELWDTIRHGQVWHSEELINRRKDGSLYYEQMTITPVQDAQGKITNYIAIKLDISDRKQAEAALHAQRDFARQVMESMGESLAVVNETGTFEYVNQALARTLGRSADSLIGTSYATLFVGDGSGLAQDTDGTRRYETSLRHTDGRVSYMRVTEVPRADTEQSGYILVFTDLSKHKQIEAELAGARDKAIEASRLKSEFLANMSHEIRTPLNGIIGMIGLLAGTRLSDEQREFAETIRTSSDSLLSIINEILDFSKIEAGRLDLEEHPFALQRCVEEALDLLAPKASENGLELVYYVAPQTPQVVLGDETRLRQILVNLIDNAVKFTPAGEVVVTVRSIVKPTACDRPGTLLEFSVRDTGIGIPRERLSSLFHPFTQVDASTTRRFGGTGLGLTISKRLAEMMGGAMWAESEPGRGSTFFFTLAVKETPAHLLPSPPRDLSGLAGKRLLIVDDNVITRSILERYATDWSMTYASFAAGQDALAYAAQEAPCDLALVDMRLPGSDGIALAAALRRLPACHGLPVVLLTPIGSAASNGAPLDGTAQLFKPVKADALARALLDLLGPTQTVAEHSEPSIPPGVAERMGDRFPLRILVAEDNLVNQKVALRMLERIGYHPDFAVNGRHALEALARQRYDVVLMDVQMPELDGIEATRQIRLVSESNFQPYIIAMTAHALDGDREHCLRSGMNDYISKPVRLESLIIALQRYQERRQPTSPITVD